MKLAIIGEKLTYFRRNMYYKAEEFITSRDCTAFLFFPRKHHTRESYIGMAMDFVPDMKMEKMRLDSERAMRRENKG